MEMECRGDYIIDTIVKAVASFARFRCFRRVGFVRAISICVEYRLVGWSCRPTIRLRAGSGDPCPTKDVGVHGLPT